MLGEAACLFAVQAPSASKFIVRFPVFAISPQKFPGEICSIELVDIVVSGAGTPIALLWHPLFSQARVQRELFMRDDSKLCLAWEARRLANVMQIPHHLALSGNFPAGDADTRVRSSICRGRDARRGFSPLYSHRDRK